MEKNKCLVYNQDCMSIMKKMSNNSVTSVITDIPYNEVSRTNNGLSQMKNSELGSADKMTFDLLEFLNECYRLATDNIIIFSGKGQFSSIFIFFAEKQNKKLGTVRQLIYEKTNPVPSNGQYVYLSGIENAVWFRKSKGIFNAHCKNTVFRYPIQQPRIHKTEKNHKLLEELILDNTNEGSLIFDPCMGSASTGLMALKNNRSFIGCELDNEVYQAAIIRLKQNFPNEVKECNGEEI